MEFRNGGGRLLRMKFTFVDSVIQTQNLIYTDIIIPHQAKTEKAYKDESHSSLLRRSFGPSCL